MADGGVLEMLASNVLLLPLTRMRTYPLPALPIPLPIPLQLK
jgi:hypothetical protein